MPCHHQVVLQHVLHWGLGEGVNRKPLLPHSHQHRHPLRFNSFSGQQRATLTTFSPPSPPSPSRPTWGECEMANREDGHIPSSDPRDSVVFQQVSYLDNNSQLMLGSRSVFDYRTDTKKPRWQMWWWWKTMRISHTRQPSRPTPPSAKERLSALGNVGNRRGNVNSDCEKVRGTFQGNMIFVAIFGRW